MSGDNTKELIGKILGINPDFFKKGLNSDCQNTEIPIVFEEKEHPEDVFVRQYIEELNQRNDRLRTENAKLKTDADKWRQLIKKAGKVGLSEADLFKMVTPIQYVESGDNQ